MSIHHLVIKAAGIAMLCLSTSCGVSKSLSSPATSNPIVEKETSLYEGSELSEINKIKGSIGIVQVRGKEAYFDQKRGALLKPPGYFQGMAPFSEGLAGVLKDNKLGFINEQGKWVIPPRFPYHDIRYPGFPYLREMFKDGLAVIDIGNKSRFINKQGQFITPAFDMARAFEKGVAVVMVNKKYGLINKQGRFIVSPQFTEEPQGDFNQGGMLVKVKGQKQCIDQRGTKTTADACKYIANEMKKVPSAFEVKDGNVYLHSRLLRDYRWDSVVGSRSNGASKGLYIYFVGKKWGLVQESGEVITPSQFDVTDSGNGYTMENFYFGYSYFHNGLAQAKISGKYGFINETGKFVIPPKFDQVESFKFDAKITAVKVGDKWGAIDRQGNFVIQPQFDSSFQFERRFGSLALFKHQGKYGFIDRQGKIVAPAKIDEIQSQDFASARGVNNFYDSLPNEGLARARIGKKWGYVNTQGKIQIPMRFDEANDFRYGIADVTLGSKTLYIDKQGKVLPF